MRVPEQNEHLNREFQNIQQNESSITSCFKSGFEDSADLLVAADGFRSRARALFLPAVQPEYAGYVAWRGGVPESDLPVRVLKVFAGCFTFFQPRGGHILS